MIFVEFGLKGVEAQPNYCIDDPEQISLERGLEVLLLLAWWIPVFRRKDDLRLGLADVVPHNYHFFPFLVW